MLQHIDKLYIVNKLKRIDAYDIKRPPFIRGLVFYAGIVYPPFSGSIMSSSLYHIIAYCINNICNINAA